MPAGRGRFDNTRSESDALSMQEVVRLLHNVVRNGVIEQIDHKKARARVRCGPLLTDWIPWHAGKAGADQGDDQTAGDSHWDPPTKGEQCTVFSPGGNMAQGVIHLGLYSDKKPQPSQDKNTRMQKLRDGTTIVHDTKQKTRTYTLPKDGTNKFIVDKQTIVVDKTGSRLENDKGKVTLQTDGLVASKNQSGSMVIASDGRAQFTNSAGASVYLDSDGSNLLNC